MQEKGRKLLKTTGIIITVLGGLAVVIGIIGAIGVGAVSAMAIANNDEGASVILPLLVGAAVLALASAVLSLVVGIVGIRNSNKPQKAKTCIVLGSIMLVLQFISLVTGVPSARETGTLLQTFGAALIWVILLGLYVYGAALNKRSISDSSEAIKT